MKVLSRAFLSTGSLPAAEPIPLQTITRVLSSDPGSTLVEFVSHQQARDWRERQRYEIEAGSETEPLLYSPLYHVLRLDDGKRARDYANFPVKPRRFAVAINYSGSHFSYRGDERLVGRAYHALKNHLHLSPFLRAEYPDSNRTSPPTAKYSHEENTLRTLEEAVAHAQTDSENPRRPPYALLVSSADALTVERALVLSDSLVAGMIDFLIAYDGWQSSVNRLSVTYPGVNPGTGYLISINLGRIMDSHLTYEEQGLKLVIRDERNPDRFIPEAVEFDAYLGVKCDPIATTEYIQFSGNERPKGAIMASDIAEAMKRDGVTKEQAERVVRGFAVEIRDGFANTIEWVRSGAYITRTQNRDRYHRLIFDVKTGVELPF